MKKLIALLACLYVSAHLTACTSKDSKDESDAPATEESTANVDGELEKVEGAEAQQAASNDGFSSEALPEEALGESAPKTETASNDTLSLDNPPVPEAATATPPAEVAAASNDASTTPPVDTALPPSEPGTGVSTDTTLPPVAVAEAPKTEPEAPKVSSPYRKIDSTPRTENGILLNSVYVARPKDNFKSVAKMIYGDEKKQKELKKANPGLSKLKVGDKVYYNSPMRPTDDQKVMTYYEDSGMTPEVYVAKEGDNLKKKSKELLGFDNAWKEVFATNAVETKGSMPAGTELKYWKSAAVSAPTMAGTDNIAMNSPPPPAAEMAPPPPAPPADLPPPPPPADLPPPPDMNAQANANPPPPPPEDMAPPADLPPPPPPEAMNPPPPPPMAKKAPAKEFAAEDGAAMDNDTLFALGGAGIVLLGVIGLVVARKRRQQKDMAAAFNDTQVGT